MTSVDTSSEELLKKQDPVPVSSSAAISIFKSATQPQQPLRSGRRTGSSIIFHFSFTIS